MKMPILRQHIRGGVPFISRSVATRSDEGGLAPLLNELDERFPGVSIGSYPRWDDGPVRVMVTFDGRVLADVDRAVAAFIDRLPTEELVELAEPATEEGR